ncbi:hypothetical protein [Streptomyces lateritius]|uniref:hypothetical protein n=1 Tax=Streptomyces lateritius TaxID=67313 RepID=UPI001C8B1431|nr:hypothetical protein [Streptomyces lateritius]MBX9426261.1 hypothetical protein [Streptomyces lateritius]
MLSSAFDGIVHRITHVLDDGDAGAWLALDEDIRALLRRGAGIPSAGAWLSDDPEHLPAPAELALALCGPDGRVREAALRHVPAAPGLLPLVVIRCSDWAAPVRERARAVLREELPRVTSEDFGDLLAVALRAGERLRGDTARAMLTGALREGPGSAVSAQLAHKDRAVRRLVHRIAVERGLLSPVRLAETAARDPDVIVQGLCANAALAAAGDPPDPDVLAPLLTARQGQVRAAGVTGLRRAGRAGEAAPFLCDRSALVRACARYVLRQAGTDPLPLYRAACASGIEGAAAMPPHAPRGLAECGDRTTDGPTLWALIGHERPEVRAGAVAGLRLLDAVRPERLVPLLDDRSPRVVRETAKALRPWSDHVPTGALSRPPSTHPSQDPSGAASEAGGGGHEGEPAKPPHRAWTVRVLDLVRRYIRPWTRGT